MRKSLDVRQWHERQFGHDSAVKAEQEEQETELGSFCKNHNVVQPTIVLISEDPHMELNMPIRAVKQKPMANMDFMRT